MICGDLLVLFEAVWFNGGDGQVLGSKVKGQSCLCFLQEENMEMTLRGSLQRLRYVTDTTPFMSLKFNTVGLTSLLSLPVLPV